MRGRNKEEEKGLLAKRRMEGPLAKEGYGGKADVGQGALSSGAVPMLAALPASDKLLLFITQLECSPHCHPRPPEHPLSFVTCPFLPLLDPSL